MIEPGLSEPDGQILFGGGGGNRTRVREDETNEESDT
jgi:hypothetical protein